MLLAGQRPLTLRDCCLCYDTVNKASRMESTSRLGYIHASGQTAEEQRAKDKDGWLKGRENHVTAKGLGAPIRLISFGGMTWAVVLPSRTLNCQSNYHSVVFVNTASFSIPYRAVPKSLIFTVLVRVGRAMFQAGSKDVRLLKMRR
jgi:hypothetical protein